MHDQTHSGSEPNLLGPMSTDSRNRMLAPDLARGLMLLLIVISNTSFFLFAAEHGPTGWHPAEGGRLDRIVQFLMIVALDMRVYPLFAFLFGYGMMTVYLRQIRSGIETAKAVRLLRRRSLWLIVFGFAHAALFLAGDILGAYGVMSLILGWIFIRRSDRTLLIAAGLAVFLLMLLVLLTFMAFMGGDVPDPERTVEAYGADETDPIAAIGTRLTTWVVVTLGGGLLGFSFHAAMLFGMWAARNRVLEEPGKHLRLLITVAAIGIPVGWIGGLPTALGHLEMMDIPDEMLVMSGCLYMLQIFTGLFGGLGYAAIITLAADSLSESIIMSPPVKLITAMGKRALTSYLLFSAIFSPILSAWGLGLGARLSSATMVLFAISVWMIVGVICTLLDQFNRRGPAEALLRRLMYGPQLSSTAE